MEYQAGDALVTAVAFATGDASYYRSTGGGKIGGRREPLVAGAARSLVALAQVQLGDLPLVKQYPTPEPGSVRVYVLTTVGPARPRGGPRPDQTPARSRSRSASASSARACCAPTPGATANTQTP